MRTNLLTETQRSEILSRLSEADGGGDLLIFAFDKTLMKPACAILQVVFGCGDWNDAFKDIFDPSDWLLAPTDAMKPMTATRSQWEAVAKGLEEVQKTAA